MFRIGVFTYSSLVQLIKKLRPDILHFHNRQELVDTIIGRLDYRPGVVVHYHRHFTQPAFPKKADQLMAPSQFTRDYLKRKMTEVRDVFVVPNPFSTELLRASGMSRPRPSVTSSPVILFGGGGGHLKGGSQLIQAFCRLPMNSARLILAGSGVEQLPGLPHPAIEVVGRVSADEFLSLMDKSDIVAVPSLDESFGLLAQEAMAMRRLLVVSAVGGGS